MKTEKQLKTYIETKLDTKFELFPGIPKPNGGFAPQREKGKESGRFWLFYNKNKDKSFCVFGDFGSESKYSIDISFEPERYGNGKIDKSNYLEEKRQFENTIKYYSEKKGFNDYLKEFNKFEPTCWIKDNVMAVPYTDKNKNIKALLRVFNNGEKRLVKFSEPKNAFHILKEPTKEKSFYYICEGIRTAYAVLLGVKEDRTAVLSAGGFSNIENAIKYVLDEGHYPVLCVENGKFYEDYIRLKTEYKCLMVGSSKHEDIYAFYKDTNLEILKRNLMSFQQDAYIPLGMTQSNKIVCYLKSSKMVVSFGTKERAELYNDTHNLTMPPKKAILDKFYWETRLLCRNIGPIKNYLKIKEGIFPYNNNMYYYDTQRLYHIKDEEIKEIDPMSIISNDCVLCKDKNYNNDNLTKIKPLNKMEVINILDNLKLFKISPLDYKLLAGWIIQSLVCGGLPYRTPIWIIAPSGTGKTKLTSNLIKNFFLFYERKTGRQTTPKWLHRYFNGKAIPLQRDEFDPSKRHSNDTFDEMEVMRTTTTERFPQRGISAGLDDTTQEFTYCFSPFYTSIQKPKELGDADLARFVFLNLRKGLPATYNTKVKEFKNFMTGKMKSRLLLTIMLKMFKIIRAYEYYMTKAYSWPGGHEKSSYIMLMCCWNMFCDKEDRLDFVKHIKPLITKKTPQYDSRIFIECLKFVLKKTNYSFPENLSLFDIIHKVNLNSDKEAGFKKFCMDKGIHIDKENTEKPKLLLHRKKSVIFLEKLSRENGEFMREKNLLSELEADGKFYEGSKIVGKRIPQVIPRGEYLIFDWNKTKEIFLGKEL